MTMERTTPYATPVNRAGRMFCLALAAVGLAGAGVGIGAHFKAQSPTVTPSPVVNTIGAVPLPVPPKPIVPVDVTPQRSPEIDRLLQAFNESEAQRREDARKATERLAELERVAVAARRAEDERRATDEAQRRQAAEQQARDDAQRTTEDRRRAEEQARQQAAWDALRQMQADQQAEAQRRAALALEEERRRIEAARRRLADRAAAGPQVTGIGLWVDRPTARGPLPQVLRFTGWVVADGPATVRYRFARSDGGLSAVQTLTFARAGRQAVTYDWTLGSRGSGWVALEVLDPNPVTSGRAAFTVTGP
jgi:multidrug efflux pump subunit AcrA (membrane-fusion protein)